MRPKVLWRLSTRLARPEAEEAVCELLESLFGQPASVQQNLETGTTTVDVYLSHKPMWTRTVRLQLIQNLRHLQQVESIRGLEPRLSRLAPKNWAQAWKRHFKPLLIGKQLLIRPSWSGRRPRKGQHEVVLDPGMSFGTGQHPTTSFCLDALLRARKTSEKQSLLDVGTGSGILAIAAAKLGYRPVLALDKDPDAVAIAGRNAQNNRVGRAIRIVCQDLEELGKPACEAYNVVCANLLADLLIAERGCLTKLILPGGFIITAGILDSEFHRVVKAYLSLGCRLVRSRREGEWRSGVFVRKI